MAESPSESKPMRALRRRALRLPDVSEGSSCTNRAFRVGGKAFAYLGIKQADYSLMVKLGDSLPEAARLQAAHPERYRVGKHGWVTVRLPLAECAPEGLLEGWIEESYRAFAP
ncbi:MAG: MmcQ/YjbR family DNA-binding protein [Planctomycetota bacterium]